MLHSTTNFCNIKTYYMDFKTATGKSIEESFDQFHKDNPDIYTYFVQYALEWIQSRKPRKISSKQIIGRIRWFLDVETEGEEAKDFKCNDAYSAYYSRKFCEQFPDHKQLFNFRNLRAL